jgi:hypothetical protein
MSTATKKPPAEKSALKISLKIPSIKSFDPYPLRRARSGNLSAPSLKLGVTISALIIAF